MAGQTFYGIEEQDRRAVNELLDWWRRTNAPPPDSAILGPAALPVMILTNGDGWKPGRCLPLLHDPLYPYVIEIVVTGYPDLLELYASEAAFFRITWRGFQSKGIPFDATAAKFAEQLETSLRDICKISGGVFTEELNGEKITYNPGRWFMGFKVPPSDAAIGVISPDSSTTEVYAAQRSTAPGKSTMAIWPLVVRETVPRAGSGSLGLAWWTQGSGLTLGGIEPRIFEGYTRSLPDPVIT